MDGLNNEKQIGFWIDVKGDEIRTKLSNRVEYHRSRANLYDKQSGEATVLTVFSADAKSLKKGHLQRAETLRFIADHVDTSASYRLTMELLNDLELTALDEQT